jgi:hypothetical protein
MSEYPFGLRGVQDELAKIDTGLSVESFAIPAGFIYGIHAGHEIQDSLWRHFRALSETIGYWPFISHSSPLAISRFRHDAGGLISAGFADYRQTASLLVESRLALEEDYAAATVGGGDWESDFDVPALELAVKSFIESGQPKPYGYGIDNFFFRPPEWVILAPGKMYDLPVALGFPRTANWRGAPVHENLTLSDHADVLRSWYERFGAVVRYFGEAAIELSVENPPQGWKEVSRVAIEQFAYCYDLEQIVGSPLDVAMRQVSSGRWLFWWD